MCVYRKEVTGSSKKAETKDGQPFGRQEGCIFIYTEDEEARKPSVTGKDPKVTELGRIYLTK